MVNEVDYLGKIQNYHSWLKAEMERYRVSTDEERAKPKIETLETVLERLDSTLPELRDLNNSNS